MYGEISLRTPEFKITVWLGIVTWDALTKIYILLLREILSTREKSSQILAFHMCYF